MLFAYAQTPTLQQHNHSNRAKLATAVFRGNFCKTKQVNKINDTKFDNEIFYIGRKMKCLLNEQKFKAQFVPRLNVALTS